MISSLTQESVWLQQPRYEAAEAEFQCYLNKSRSPATKDNTGSSTLVNDIQQIRQQIQTAMNNTVDEEATHTLDLEQRVSYLEKENRELKQAVEELRKMTSSLNTQLKSGTKSNVDTDKNCNVVTKMEVEGTENAESADDDVDLFGSDEDESEAKQRAERIKAYEVKKAKKPALIAKSSVTFDIKPWDDETDMKKMEECVRTIEMDGLIWGASKLAPLAYGIKKLTILCVVEDEKVSIDDLEEQIVKFEDYVQSVDIAAFNKI